MSAARDEEVDELKDGRRDRELEIVMTVDLHAVGCDRSEFVFFDCRNFVEHRRLGDLRLLGGFVNVSGLSLVLVNSTEKVVVVRGKFCVGSKVNSGLKHRIKRVIKHLSRDVEQTFARSFFTSPKALLCPVDDRLSGLR